MIRYINLPEADSTNSYISRNVADMVGNTVVSTDRQTAGRGQRGNSWESEPLKNLTFSILLRPDNFPANRQFAISEAVAVGVVKAVKKICGVELKIKWPNDIYFNNKKICGILIEHAVMGSNILHTIAGIGLNVNQQQFFSDAPNPISLLQITKKETNRDLLLKEICEEIISSISNLADNRDFDSLHSQFMKNLWRNDMMPHKFRDVETQREYIGYVGEVETTGHISIYEPTDETIGFFDRSSCICHRYAFKEVEWILD